jgi:hypothetical protein
MLSAASSYHFMGTYSLIRSLFEIVITALIFQMSGDHLKDLTRCSYPVLTSFRGCFTLTAHERGSRASPTEVLIVSEASGQDGSDLLRSSLGVGKVSVLGALVPRAEIRERASTF